MPEVTPTMEALVLLEPNRIEIREVPTPVPGPFEVLARVHAASICPADAKLIAGGYPNLWPPSFPFIPGHEWAGEIAALGPGTELLGFKVGDRVAGTPHDACGYCQRCVEGRYNVCENDGKAGLHKLYGHNYPGADATYVVHGVKAVFHLPDEIGYEDGSIIDSASQALHVANRGNIQPGDTVAITDAGAVGLLAGDAALVRGAARVIFVEAKAWRRAKAAEMGFETVDPSAGDPVAAARDMTDDVGVDVVLDPAGLPANVQAGMRMLRRGGRCAVNGIPGSDFEVPMQRLVIDEIDLVGSRATAGEMTRVMPLVANDRIRVHEVATHRFPLAEYGKALAAFLDPDSRALKIVVVP